MKVKKYLRGEGANLEGLRDKKLKGQLAIREELYGKSAKAAAKAEKVRVLCEKAKGILMEESNGSSQFAILGEATINLLIMLMH
ncbi:uncharacterized protein LOC114264033 isoform X5 [Camellia sinensis]|nr:uncharacterized protein LOC114264033 isoform X5 [Camellia sinensis]